MTRPPHLDGLPRLDDAEFLYGDADGEAVSAVHGAAIRRLGAELSSAFETNFLVLGSYTTRADHEGQKDRLEQTRRQIETLPEDTNAYLLDDLDPEGDDWANFYLKFRFTLVASDCVFLVAEDNDGGHELELGEVPLADLFVFRRDYADISIDHDIEYEKYDAMMNTLFDLLEERERLWRWNTTDELLKHVARRAAEEA